MDGRRRDRGRDPERERADVYQEVRSFFPLSEQKFLDTILAQENPICCVLRRNLKVNHTVMYRNQQMAPKGNRNFSSRLTLWQLILCLGL